MPAPVNYTTKVPATRTCGEMQEMLAKNGASRIAVEYENGYPSGIMFALDTVLGTRVFELPVDIGRVEKMLKKYRPTGGMSTTQFHTRDHAARVGWRIMKDWLGAQLALIESQMVDLNQVMLPYMKVDDGHTLYAAWRDREAGLLELEAAQ